MAKGIGIDMVSISATAQLLGDVLGGGAGAPGQDGARDSFARRTFTAAELACARERRDPASFLAGRLAVKQATAKALASLPSPAEPNAFDPRWVETLPAPSGAPVATASEQLGTLLRDAGCDAGELLASISNEGDLAVAMVLVQ